ncbi:hypothetical protein [Aliiroseovarius sp.]|uniref:hypothetical protein n=1 Tax=Aliiroseovarius sp. TaxID=1872442 RepID=UPI003BABFD2C
MIRAALISLIASPAAALPGAMELGCDFQFRCIEGRCVFHDETARLHLTPTGATPGFIGQVTRGDTDHPAMGNTETSGDAIVTQIEFSDPQNARFLTVHDDGRAMMRLLEPPLRTLLLGTCKEVE